MLISPLNSIKMEAFSAHATCTAKLGSGHNHSPTTTMQPADHLTVLLMYSVPVEYKLVWKVNLLIVAGLC